MKLLMLGTWEIVIIVLAVLLLFGGKKIPELMRGLGKGVKEFRDGMNGIEGKENNSESNKSDNKTTNQDGSTNS